MTEKWLACCKGLYAVSNLGRLRRDKPGLRGAKAGRIIKGSKTLGGYPSAVVVIDGKFVGVLIHRLVAAAFIGPCPLGKEVNHIDGVKTNNNVANLEYVTRSENHRHAYRLGLKRAHRQRLTAKDVARIRRRRAAGESLRCIAKDYGVGFSNISAITCRRTWKYVT